MRSPLERFADKRDYMKYRFCVFDIDGVLNPAGKPVQKESLEALEMLENQGLKISFASGKHPWYITGGLVFSGLLREDTVIIGEAGGHVFFPHSRESVLYTQYYKDIKKLKKIFYESQLFRNEFWEEPKETLFSLFPKQWGNVPVIAQKLQKIIDKEGLNLYIITHIDAIDAMQNGLSKEVGLKILSERLNISLKEMIAFGDGMNDFEMLSCVGYPVAVGNAVEKIKEIVKNRDGYIADEKYGRGVLEAADHIIKNIL